MSTEVINPESLIGKQGEMQYRILGSMLADNSLIADVVAKIKPADFLGVVVPGKANTTGAQLRRAAFDAITNRGARTLEALRECLSTENNLFRGPAREEYVNALIEKIDASEVHENFAHYVDQLANGKQLPLVSAGRFETVSITPEPGEGLAIPYIVEGVLPEGQPTIIGGHAKTLKTSTLIDLCVSVVAGKHFLGNPAFAVHESRPVLLASCESGPHTIREVFDRVCRAKKCNPETVKRDGFHFTPTIPNLQDESEIAAFESLIARTGAKVVGMDPLYQAGIAESTTNMSKFGELVKPLVEACNRRGATLVVCHHFKQGAETRSMGLGSLFGSGSAQWARAWMLLGPLADFKIETGEHRLRMILGGSAGHASDWEVNVREGRQQDKGGRVWSVTTQPAREPQAAGQRGEKAADRKRADVLAAIRGFSSPDTFTAIRKVVRFGGEPLKEIVEALIESGEVRRRRVTKGRKSCECFEAVAKGGCE